MEFWGVEVKVGETVKVDPDEWNANLRISQAALGEAKRDKASEPVVLYLKVDDRKFVLGTLSRENIPQQTFELMLEKEFELSHNSKNASVYFCGNKIVPEDEHVPSGFSVDDDDFSDSDEDIALMNKDNGKPEKKAEEVKVAESKKPVAKVEASEKQVKIVDPKKDEEDESDDESVDEDESGNSDEMDDDIDSDDEESDSEEDEETAPPKKVDQGKKRPNDSASKTPVPTKKAKAATPEKTDGQKSEHIATPHPMKKGGKTPNSGAKDHSGGQLSCKSCNKSFTSEAGLQQHKKAKHGGQ